MHVVTGGRQCGKTTQLIKLAASSGGTIVCVNYPRACHVQHLAMELGLKIAKPVTLDQLLSRRVRIAGRSRAPSASILIDDAQDALQTLTSVPIHAVSVDLPAPQGVHDVSLFQDLQTTLAEQDDVLDDLINEFKGEIELLDLAISNTVRPQLRFIHYKDMPKYGKR